MPRSTRAGGQVLHESCVLVRSSASSSSQTFSTVRLVFGALVNGVSQRIDRGQKGVWVVTRRDVTDKIRQKVVETFRISGDDESRKGTPIFGCLTLWVIGIPFFLWFFAILAGLLGMGEWYSANIIEGFVEPFLENGGLYVLFVVAAIGLIVDFVFIVRDWIRGRRRRRQRKEI